MFSIFCAQGQTRDFFEDEPIRYSLATPLDPVARLAQQVASGERQVQARSTREFLIWLLDALDISKHSQVLVFSKTSLQIGLISPKTPRAIYYNRDVYVGYVPGGVIEIAAMDPQLGAVFYEADFRNSARDEIFTRETKACLSCHSGSRTEGVAGVFVRSVHAGADGHVLGNRAEFLSNDSLAMEHRWGGYYITGSGPDVLHIGNQLFSETNEPVPMDLWYENLNSVIDTHHYLTPKADILALMLLEHQTRVHNVMARASLQLRRKEFVDLAFEGVPGFSANDGEEALERWVRDIVAVLTFADEAKIGGDGMQGDEEVEMALRKMAPVASSGRSLLDVRLHPRVMKQRCSYMIYSGMFRGLPDSLRLGVLQRLRAVMAGKDPEFDHLGTKERKRIDLILRETVADY